MRRTRDRRERVRLVHASEVGRAGGQGVRATATGEGVPASTVYRWLAHKDAIDAPEAVRDFFVSPEGLEVLHEIVTALHLVFGQAAGDGVDRLCQFLDLSRLDRFVAASHGSQQAVAVRMAELLAQYDEEQRGKLGSTMRPRSIVVCEDETFHPELCLVAIDAESGMILVECYCERRDGTTWTSMLGAALDGLPVTVVCVVGDEAKGLIAHARDGLGVPHHPDLFHGQHDLFKATSLPLAARLKQPREDLTEAEAHTQAWRDAKADYERGPRPPGRPLDYDRRIAAAEAAELAARTAYDAAVQDQADARAAIAGLSETYHPFSLTTGALQSAEAVSQQLAATFATIDAVADRARLSERCRERIDKARRLIPGFVASVAFFHRYVELALLALPLSPAVLEVIQTQLLPGLYLANAARKARTAAERAAIAVVSKNLLARARAPTSPLMALDHATRARVEALALACVHTFVRSSACVEGRNGQLALYHHGLHRLSKRRLRALTVIHNYFIRRSDGTTAAERFFGRPPDDLFPWLLARLEVPAQPRAKRLKPAA